MFDPQILCLESDFASRVGARQKLCYQMMILITVAPLHLQILGASFHHHVEFLLHLFEQATQSIFAKDSSDSELERFPLEFSKLNKRVTQTCLHLL
jgi:hypothetical protein